MCCGLRPDVDVMVNRGYRVIGLWVELGMVCVLCCLQLPSLFM